jgi:mono/diheme cytochrome c family protein
MPVRPTLKFVFAAAAVIVAWPVHAQEGNVGRGAEIARNICAACHVVTRRQSAAPNSQAPPFSAIASTPGMTSIIMEKMAESALQFDNSTYKCALDGEAVYALG